MTFEEWLRGQSLTLWGPNELFARSAFAAGVASQRAENRKVELDANNYRVLHDRLRTQLVNAAMARDTDRLIHLGDQAEIDRLRRLIRNRHQPLNRLGKPCVCAACEALSVV